MLLLQCVFSDDANLNSCYMVTQTHPIDFVVFSGKTNLTDVMDTFRSKMPIHRYSLVSTDLTDFNECDGNTDLVPKRISVLSLAGSMSRLTFSSLQYSSHYIILWRPLDKSEHNSSFLFGDRI